MYERGGFAGDGDEDVTKVNSSKKGFFKEVVVVFVSRAGATLNRVGLACSRILGQLGESWPNI